MKKTVQSVKNSLKFKAQPKSGILSVRVGVKKYSIPVDARMLSDEKFLFLSFPATSDLYRIESKQLVVMKTDEDASDVLEALTPAKKRTRKRGAASEVPKELTDILKNLPSGYRLGYGPDGTPKLVRTRRRTPKNK